MICFLCKQESDLALCKACSARLTALMPKASSIPHAAKLIQQRDERFYWRVHYENFVAIVDGRDASNEDEAFREAFDPLTRWYFVGGEGIDYLNMEIKRITHNEFVDWLRQGKRSLFVRTT